MTAPSHPGVSEAHLALAKIYSSPSLSGPPLSGKLIALVEHMYTEEEADILRHLKPMRAKKATSLAKAARRPVGEVAAILKRLAHEMNLILPVGRDGDERYSLLPVVPGTFEWALMRPTTDDLTEWHTRFAELFEDLFETGYIGDYAGKPAPAIRYIPVGEVIESLPSALPSDKLEDILDRYDQYSIAVCQCRLSKKLIGEGCGKMLETCTAFGDIAGWLVQNGKAKSASRKDVLEVKSAAESEGLVTWMFNVGNQSKYNGSCSCCGCCCGALRAATQYHSIGMIAPPHFKPRFNKAECSYCGKCADICQMKAVLVESKGEEKSLTHVSELCIGCGLCAVACSKNAITMAEVPDYERPPASWPRHALKYLPTTINNMRRVRNDRKRS